MKESEFWPYRRLAATIILRAIADILAGPGRLGGEQIGNYRSALRFLKTSWFETLAEAVNIDPESVRGIFLDKEKRRQAVQASKKRATLLKQVL